MWPDESQVVELKDMKVEFLHPSASSSETLPSIPSDSCSWGGSLELYWPSDLQHMLPATIYHIPLMPKG
ncbi:hypothetical protein CgunFtcFv8_015502 [Champsocephalus gunnari]|uniref:Uncharacterized protein n=1 Tax=Champsocephalus gunnari TaxID=52237 RepID=A0AAN8C6K9_CHAGU|nr:hypothetical protein CgunFtcFv8_015502 [Champsocephalus gunnari]